MSRTISDPEAARPLARAILPDICLYDGEQIAAGTPLNKELAEGQALFASPSRRSPFSSRCAPCQQNAAVDARQDVT